MTALGASLLLLFYSVTARAQLGSGSASPPGPTSRRPTIDMQRELSTKITAPFTVAIAGDINYNYPIAKLGDPSVQAALSIFRNADVGFGNLEAGTLNAEFNDKEMADDIKAMGFNVLTRANNGSNAPEDVILRVGQLLRDRGIMWAGEGMNLDEARAAQFLETSKGRIGLVGMVSISPAGEGPPLSATYAFQGNPGTPGGDGLHLAMYQVVSPDQLEALRKVRDELYLHRIELGGAYPVPLIPADEPKDTLVFTRLGEWFKAGDQPGTLTFTMNPSDEHDILRSIRNGKEYSDFMIATIHSHEDTSPLARASTSEYPADFLITLAHEAIDNGADIFVGHGVHTLRGIEIYKGKPIFYDMHSITYQLNLKQPGLGMYLQDKQNPFTSNVTGEELEWDQWDSPDYPRLGYPDQMWTLAAVCKYDKGQLQEVILHPIDLGFGAPMADVGIPHVPSPEVAQEILQHMQKISEPFGTKIAIEGNLGVIHVADASTE